MQQRGSASSPVSSLLETRWSSIATVQLKFGVPDELDLEVELEFEEGKTELEIELHW